MAQLTAWAMMGAMRPIASLRRSIHRDQVDVRTPLRLREPRGLISPSTATDLLAQFTGSRIGAADTSMDRLVLAISAEPMHLLVISGAVTFTATGTGPDEISVCHTPSSAEALAAMGAVTGRTITGVRVAADGGLVLSHDRGSLAIAADPSHEAWEIRGMDGGLLACLPGGSISLWAPTVAQPQA